MGTFLIYRLAGGTAGMRHFMAQFGPTLQLPWTKLTDVPELDDELLDTLVAQSDAQAAGRSIEELARIRDDCLVAVLSGLRGQAWGAGEWTSKRPSGAGNGQRATASLPRATASLPRATASLPRATASRRQTTVSLPQPMAGATGDDGRLRLHDVIVAPEWIDYNGHMTEYRYLEVLANTTDVFLALIGAGGDYAASGSSYYTVETHIRHLAEARVGDRLAVGTQLLHHDSKRLHLFPRDSPRRRRYCPVATGEHMLLHVDTAAGRAIACRRRRAGGAGPDRGRPGRAVRARWRRPRDRGLSIGRCGPHGDPG